MKAYGLSMACLLALGLFGPAGIAFAQDKPAGDKPVVETPIVGLIPRAPKPVKLDGKLEEWDAAFVTPVHVGHPDFANRGAHVLYLWDDENLYVGLRCLDQKPAHIGAANQIWNGDAVEFYLDTRRGTQFGGPDYRPGTLHMYWTPFTGSDLKPQLQVRDIPAFKNVKLEGAAVAGEITSWGYTAEFKLPWANFPNFAIESGEVIGLDCELCSSDGGPRTDRTFVYSSPAAVGTPSVLGRVRLVDKLDPDPLKPLGRALLPFSLSKSSNYDWLYNTACVSPTIEKAVAKLEGKIVDQRGAVKKTAIASKRPAVAGSDINLWRHRWELYDLPPGDYSLELSALDADGKVLVARTEKFIHSGAVPAPAKRGDDSPPKEKEKEGAKEKKKEKEKEKEKPKQPEQPEPTKKNEKPPAKEKEDKPPPDKSQDLPPRDAPRKAAS